MPHSITTFGTGPGFARYQVGSGEELVISSASVLIINPNTSPYLQPFFSCDDAAGNGIYRQFLGLQTRGQVGYYLSRGGADMYVDNSAAQGFPQNSAKYGAAFVNLTIPEIVLGDGCTVGFYCSSLFLDPGTDVMGFLQAVPNSVQFAHLWAEDTAGSQLRNLPPPQPVGPYMLVPGPPVDSVAV